MRFMPLLLGLGCAGGEDTDVTEEPLDPEGMHFEMVLGGVTIPDTDPALAQLFASAFSRPIVVQIHDVTDTELQLRIGLMELNSDPLEQDFCIPTADLPIATRDDLSFEMGPTDFTFYTTTNPVLIRDAAGAGRVATTGEQLLDAWFSGTMDLEELQEPEEAADSCELLASYGLECFACEGGSDHCFSVRVEDLLGNRVDVALEAVEPDDDRCVEE